MLWIANLKISSGLVKFLSEVNDNKKQPFKKKTVFRYKLKKTKTYKLLEIPNSKPLISAKPRNLPIPEYPGLVTLDKSSNI